MAATSPVPTVNVLLIEDSPLDAQVVQQALSRPEGHPLEIAWSESLTDGLARLGHQPIDVVLLDLQLPDSDGLDSVVRVRDQDPRVAIVVLTANDDARLALRALQEGAQDYLAKGYIQVYRHLLERSIRYAIERKRAQEALRQAREHLEQRVRERTAELTRANEATLATQAKFQAFMDNSPMWACIKDAAGRYVYVNRPFERCFQSPPESLGKTDFDLWPHAVASTLREHDQRALETGRTVELIESIPTPDGRPREWLMVRFPINGPSGARLLGAMAVDVTERRQAERVKEEFLEVLSHEFRTPLTAVGEGVRLLADSSLGACNADQLDVLSTMALELDRLNAVLDKMALAGRLITNRMSYEFRSTDLRMVADHLMRLLAPAAVIQGVRLELVAPPEALPVRADAEWLVEALRQVAVNAIQVTPRDGVVTLSCLPAKDGVEFSVTDTGPGIPKHEQETLFTRFHWTGGVNDRKTGGLGLGLFVAQSIVTAHNGSLTIHSQPGSGTRMVVHLPAGHS